MKVLPLKFTKKSQRFTQLKREGDLALYKRNSIEFPKSITYEVVIITRHNGTTINGNYIEPGELYPSTSQWGSHGWTYCSAEAAEEGFKKILKKMSRPKKQKTSGNKNVK